jgi:hypothetical protein
MLGTVFKYSTYGSPYLPTAASYATASAPGTAPVACAWRRAQMKSGERRARGRRQARRVGRFWRSRPEKMRMLPA